MKNLDVEHYLSLYKFRRQGFEKGIKKPSREIKEFMDEFIEILSKMNPKETVEIRDHSFFDSKSNLISRLPIEKITKQNKT